MPKLAISCAMLAALTTGTALAQTAPPTFMSADWGKALCNGWNGSETLTKNLAGSWVKNNGGTAYKTLQVMDSSCTPAPAVALKISLENGMAHCLYGGAYDGAKLNHDYDYTMWATTKNWQNMGSPMTAMMFGRLNFEGPKLEAMSNMGPFGAFLDLVAKIPATPISCTAS